MTVATETEIAGLPAGSDVRQYVTFLVDDSIYGVDINLVREIKQWSPTTVLPNQPHYTKGVLNLRGTIVPILDLRLKFHLSKAEYNDFTVMIILNVADRGVGIVVDGVSDVIDLPEESIRPAPEIGGSVDSQHITGIGTVDNRMLILLDIEKLITSADMGLVSATSH